MKQTLHRQLGALMTVLLPAALSACGGGGSSDAPSGDTNGKCTATAEKQWVLEVARSWYYFLDLLPQDVDPAAFADAAALLDHLTAEAAAQSKDRGFSYLTTKAADEANTQGEQPAGFGLRLGLTPDERLFVLEVLETGPAGSSPLARGAELLAIDSGEGYESIEQLLAEDPTLGQAFDVEAGEARGFRYTLAGRTDETVLAAAVYAVDAIPDDGGAKILPLAGSPGVGYLNFRSFISTAEPDLYEAFAAFQSAGLSDFIIDLRYNGGGLVSLEEVFENLMAALLDGELSHELRFNENHPERTRSTYFERQPESVAPVRVAFITTGGTASASELLVNSFAPYVQVAIVGSDTYGKPVGQSAFDLDGCETRLRLVTFSTVNADGEADYYEGLAGTLPYACAAADDLGYEQGDPLEDSTRTALDWLQTGVCAGAAISATKAEPAGLRPLGARDGEPPLFPGLR